MSAETWFWYQMISTLVARSKIRELLKFRLNATHRTCNSSTLAPVSQNKKASLFFCKVLHSFLEAGQFSLFFMHAEQKLSGRIHKSWICSLWHHQTDIDWHSSFNPIYWNSRFWSKNLYVRSKLNDFMQIAKAPPSSQFEGHGVLWSECECQTRQVSHSCNCYLVRSQVLGIKYKITFSKIWNAIF